MRFSFLAVIAASCVLAACSSATPPSAAPVATVGAPGAERLGPAPERPIGPTWWKPGTRVWATFPGGYTGNVIRNALLDEVSATAYVPTGEGMSALRVSDGSTLWTTRHAPLWIGQVGGTLRIFATRPDAIVELSPATGEEVRAFPFSSTSVTMVREPYVEGNALVVTWEAARTGFHGGAPQPNPIVLPGDAIGAVFFVPLDTASSNEVHGERVSAWAWLPSRVLPPGSPADHDARLETAGTKLVLHTIGDAKTVVVEDPAPRAGYAQPYPSDARHFVYLRTNDEPVGGKPPGSLNTWRVFDATTGELTTELPVDRCSTPPFIVNDVILAVQSNGLERAFAALEIRDGKLRWGHGMPPIPMPIPYPQPGAH